MNVDSHRHNGTKQCILDAAEYLFSQDAYRGTSLRAITARANVNLAAVNYHFGTKETLLEEVIKRRILPLNEIRRQRIEEIRSSAGKKGRTPNIKSLLLAFIEPTLLFKESSPEAKNFMTFIGRSITDPDDTVRKVFHRFIMPLFTLLYETACESLPDHPRDLILWRLHFTVGALFHTLHICGNFKTDDIMQCDSDVEAKRLVNLIIPYVTAGMKAK
jgi:AcrR family transcriptional regulator